MTRLRLLWALGRPGMVALSALLALAGSALSPDFLSAGFARSWMGLPAPVSSAVYALGAMLVVSLLWFGTSLVGVADDQAIAFLLARSRRQRGATLPPLTVLRWGLGMQVAAFALTALGGSRTELLLALVGAGLGNIFVLGQGVLARYGPIHAFAAGGGAVLFMSGGLMAQGGITQVGLLAACALGLVATALAPIRDFIDPEGDRQQGMLTFLELLGPRTAALAGLGAVFVSYAVATLLLVQAIGIQERVLALLALPLSGHLYQMSKLLSSPQSSTAHRAHNQSVLIYLGLVFLYVGAQAIY